MCTLDIVEEKLVVPVLIRELSEHPDGLTLEELKGALARNNLCKTRERLIEICAVFFSVRRTDDVIRYVPNCELFATVH